MPEVLHLEVSTTFWIYFFLDHMPIPEKPTFTAQDVTVVIPTIHNAFEELQQSLESILACEPFELILVTTASRLGKLEKLAGSLRKSDATTVRVLCINVANKRLQVCRALPEVQTQVIILADDDVAWPKTLVPWVLAPFEDEAIGGVGTCQFVKRLRPGTPEAASWTTQAVNWLGAAYIHRRNFEITATHNMDGGTSCMSGRTVAYRSEILQNPSFFHDFQTEVWGDCILNADDDNFVTRWLVNHQWKTWIQYERECEVETTLENDVKFLYQCSRWARSNWRSNWTSLFRDKYVWTQQPWSTYALHIATFTSLAILVDPLLLFSCWKATEGWDMADRQLAFWAQFGFMFGFTKVVKLVGLFLRSPSDIKFLPISIVFGYFHGLIKIYALFTLKMTSWGSREDADMNDDVRLAPRPRRSPSLDLPSKPDVSLPQYSQLRPRLNMSPGRKVLLDYIDSTEKTALLEAIAH